jgi:hypothetical protein
LKYSRIAKNLLENKTCDNCTFRDPEVVAEYIMGLSHCKFYKESPSMQTCEHWAQIIYHTAYLGSELKTT